MATEPIAWLDNDERTPCIGCGPHNAAGLRLRFARRPDGRGASAEWTPDAAWQGFPGNVHSAGLYLALIETMNWSLYAHTGGTGLPTRTAALDMRRRVAIGETLVLRGQVVSLE